MEKSGIFRTLILIIKMQKNAYPPTSLFLPYLFWVLDYQVMDSHDLVMEKS